LDQDYGMAFQQAGLFDWRTVSKNIELPLELKGWDKNKRSDRAKEMLELVKLPEFGELYPWQLSGGMQQRIAIARALAAHPPLLLMDEPFGALDEMTREYMQGELLRICAETGTTVVFVTHSIPEAVYLSHRVVVMSPRPGRITDLIDVKLGKGRTEDTRNADEFFQGITAVREALRGSHADHVASNAVRGFLGLWEGAVRGFNLKPYFLAPPSKIVEQFWSNISRIWEAASVSGMNALVGLVVGTVLGVAMSFVLSRYKFLGELITPLAIALNAIPIFVLVAVLNNMYSITSEIPRRFMVTLVVYFIVLVNVAKGLTQVRSTHVELMRSYAASEFEILRKVRVPNAVPYLFTALKIAAPASVITAFVSEYFGGSQNGLGSRITSNIANSKNAAAWAYVLGACLLGLVFYIVSVVLENVTSRGGGATNNNSK
jgi:ABC-type nitrate/sulfonate/bicarbonate transport system ATPase subunit/ABC-type nitrate/sulfonate/bicarbonate transport system permease component